MPGRTIYEKLASAFTEEQAVLYNQRVEEISPNIRYCAYNIGEASRDSTGFVAMEEGLISSGGRNLRLPLQF